MKKEIKILLQLSPLLIIFLGLFVMGIFVTLLQSFHIIGLSSGKPTLIPYELIPHEVVCSSGERHLISRK